MSFKTFTRQPGFHHTSCRAGAAGAGAGAAGGTDYAGGKGGEAERGLGAHQRRRAMSRLCACCQVCAHTGHGPSAGNAQGGAAAGGAGRV
eukprot:3393061-Rhodomonas_salina.1